MVRVRRYPRRRPRRGTLRMLTTREEVTPLRVRLPPDYRVVDKRLLKLVIENMSSLEFGAAVRADGSYVLVRGGEGAINLTEGQENPNYLYKIHSHPNGSPPSVHDVLNLWGDKTEKLGIVIADNMSSNAIWGMRKTEKRETNPDRVFDLFSRYQDFQREGTLTHRIGGAAEGFAEAIGMEMKLLASIKKRRW